MESISSAGVVELRIHVSVSAMMSGLWLSVRSLSAVTCSGVNMERVLRVQMRRFEGWMGPGLGWMCPQRSSVAVSKERRVDECRERAVKVMYAGGSLFRWVYICVDMR